MGDTEKSLVPRLAISVLRRSGSLERYFELRRASRRRIGAVRGHISRHRLRRHLDDGIQPMITPDGRALVADVDRRFVAHERMIDNLKAVCSALAAADIEFRLCPIASAQRYRLAVNDEDRRRAWTALHSSVARPSVYLAFADVSAPHLRPLTSIREMPPAASSADIWYYFRAITNGGSRVIGIEHACEVEFSSRTHDLPSEARVPESVDVGGHQIPSWQPFAQVFASKRQRFPVDVVYTWVDDTDPNWIAQRAKCQGQQSAVSMDGDNARRWANRDELRYSLRSLEAYADFVRHVYLVTDRQRPSWLADTDRLTVVDHRDLFDVDAAVPTFNSHAIESRLHHIDGLSEHYLYLNDDVFFGRRVTAASFFEPSGIPKFFLSKATIPPGPPRSDEPSVDSAAKNGRDLLFRAYGYAPTQKLKHTPHAQRRSTLAELEGSFPDEFKRLQHRRFRTADDISVAASVHHHCGYITGRAVPGSIRYQYVSLAAGNLPDRLEDLTSGRWDTFCLNDAEMPPAPDRVNRVVAEWLPRAFPFASQFEREQTR